MANQKTEKIRLWGIVQGVGFRPFVAKLADRCDMKGEVLNVGGLVDIVVTDTSDKIDAFVKALQQEKPEPAEIVHIKRETVRLREFEQFTILDSDEGDDEAAILPADLSICPDCLAELQDENNPRSQHPFISCMACGPRYTIIDKIPYDRQNTAMIEFPMCDFCTEEYTNRMDRRYHAQTISCHNCGPVLEYYINESCSRNDSACSIGFIGLDAHANHVNAEQVKSALISIAIAWALIAEGQVIAFKGVGGYNLVCSPFHEEAVAALREIKGREQKPFALMFRDIKQVKEFCTLDSVEESLLLSSAKPILLLERKQRLELEKLREAQGNQECQNNLACHLKKTDSLESLCESRFIGSFLPSMGAQYQLLEIINQPLIVTSANLSNMPIIKDDDEMLAMIEARPQIAAMFYNKRKIRVRMDDSVARVIDGQPQMIRRSKGYAPVPLYISGGGPMTFAAGGQLKNSFSLSKGNFAYMSQYFGDLDSLENQQIYDENVRRMKSLFRIEPEVVVCDLHPQYATTVFAKRYAQEHHLPLIQVQHHHAHVASVMAEHNLAGEVIGVSFDGTGYGTDGAIWGGEFLLCNGSSFERMAHLKYIKMLGGDSSMKEAWKSAICYKYAWETGYRDTAVSDEITLDLAEIISYRKIENENRHLVETALLHSVNTIESSSMGRLFDAVAALLNIKDYNDYEGQCAILLEDAAARAQRNPGKCMADDLALKFHKDVAQMILERCSLIRNERETSKVALTGGTFQNKILMEETLRLLRNADFEVYYNISVSPNDGGIALGQTYIAMKGSKSHGH